MRPIKQDEFICSVCPLFSCSNMVAAFMSQHECGAHISAKYPTAKNEENMCKETCPAGWSCTRPKGHKGLHEAGLWGGQKRKHPIAIARWRKGKHD